MRAIEISEFGAPQVLKMTERPTPHVQPRDVLIRVQAAGVARAPAGASDLPGLDVAGTVAAVGSAVTGYVPGNRVCAILSGGGYAEYCAVPLEQVLPIPESWTPVEAATLPENLFTAYDNVVTRAGLSDGQTILIHGGTSGVGTMAIMLAQLLDSKIIVTAGTDEKCRACLNLGAHHAINYKTTPDFALEAKRLTDGYGVDVILDMVGGSYLARNLTALANEGRMVVIATQGGHLAQLDLSMLMIKRARIMGSTMRARTAAEKGRVAAALEKNVWPQLPDKKHIRPIIDSIFPLADAAAAHHRLESGHTIGKVVLKVAE